MSPKLTVLSSLKKYFMPEIAALISSTGLLQFKRHIAEFKRRTVNQPHTVEVYIKLTDPYSYLLLQVLPELAAAYPLEYRFYLLDDLPSIMFPEPERWQQHALSDAQHLATLYNLSYQHPLPLPKQLGDIQAYQALLVHCQDLKSILSYFHQFWQGQTFTAKKSAKKRTINTPEQTQEMLSLNLQRLIKKGHYQSAMLHYQGEWYWGLDRLCHLEQRFIELELAKGPALFQRQHNIGAQINNNPPTPCPSQHKNKPASLILYFSMRSPYSYLGLEQAIKLTTKYKIPLELRPVLPMVMRGLSVPQVKKMYIFHDSKREARRLGLPYGKVADPLGLAVEYCYALFTYAKREGKEVEFISEFARAVNSQGLYGDNEAGLAEIIQRSGLDWSQAISYLQDNSWRHWAAQHQQQLQSLGLWGVPCFKWGETVLWGQDRLWVIEQQLIEIESDIKH